MTRNHNARKNSGLLISAAGLAGLTALLLHGSGAENPQSAESTPVAIGSALTSPPTKEQLKDNTVLKVVQNEGGTMTNAALVLADSQGLDLKNAQVQQAINVLGNNMATAANYDATTGAGTVYIEASSPIKDPSILDLSPGTSLGHGNIHGNEQITRES
jgi:hypothetical protein